MPNPTLPKEEPNEFDGMTIEQVAAFVFRDGGETALREAFRQAGEIEPNTKESLEQTATALEQRGLNAPATIMRQIAAEAPNEDDLCPYPEPGHNRDYWLHTRRLRRMAKSGESEAKLRCKARKKRH